MELQVLSGLTLNDVINDLEAPDEVVGAAVDVLNDMSKRLRDAKMVLQGRLIDRMTKENATKFPFVSSTGIQKIATLKAGAMECDRDDADEFYTQNGFDPHEIGKYVFEPSWSKAKEARKMGGTKQLAIDELFKLGKPSLKIEEVKKKVS